MTNLPNVTHLSGGSATEAQFQSAIADLYNFTKELLPGATPEAITIDASGVIAPTSSNITVDTYNTTSADNLDLITPTTIGAKMISINIASSARVVTLRHNQTGTGKLNLLGGVDCVLRDTSYRIFLVWNATTSKWDEYWRNFGVFLPSAEQAALRSALGMGTAALVNTGTSSGNVPLVSQLGTAAFINTGTSSGNVSLNSQLGALAFLSTITNSQLDTVNSTPSTAGGVTANAQGRVTAMSQALTGNTLVLNGATGTTNTGDINITGDFKKNGTVIGGDVVKLGSYTVTDSHTLNITDLPTSGYSSFIFKGRGLHSMDSNGDVEIKFIVSTNNGTSHLQGYDYSWLYTDNYGASSYNAFVNIETALQIGFAPSGHANYGSPPSVSRFELTLDNPHEATRNKSGWLNYGWINYSSSQPNIEAGNFEGRNPKHTPVGIRNSAAINAVRFYSTSSYTWRGVIDVYGVK